MLFKKEFGSGKTFEYMIVGLGNPGTKYDMTRHNTGFMCIDLLAMKQDVKINRLKFKALIGDTVIAGKRCLLLKPQTYMNLSGEAVKEAADFYKIPPENIIVIFDDISLDVGKLRIRRKGSDGGHNGIKSIIAQLGNSNFPRIKVGIGAKPNPEYDLADWVLSRYTKDEAKLLRQAADDAISSIEYMVNGKIDKAMSDFNS